MKDLKTEYSKDIDSNLPDLWDRINTGLDEIEGPQDKKEEKTKKTQIIKLTSKILGCVAAACLIVVIFKFGIPMISLSKSGPAENYEAKTNSAASEQAKISDAKYKVATDASQMDESLMETKDGTSDEVVEPGDGTYMLNGVIYKYKLELYGDMGDGVQGRAVILSNTLDITFEQAVLASSPDSDATDETPYFDPQEAIIISFEAVSEE